MGKLTPSLAAETEALREAYAALNRNDIPAAVKAFDPQIEWTEPAEYPGERLTSVGPHETPSRSGYPHQGSICIRRGRPSSVRRGTCYWK